MVINTILSVINLWTSVQKPLNFFLIKGKITQPPKFCPSKILGYTVFYRFIGENALSYMLFFVQMALLVI